ncbi:MAG: ribonuclease H family protein [Bacteroidales bacterium]|nr:ribonuclease H family protein [Bacteroidales bacterium]
MSKSKKKYYVVWEGRERGVFSSWDECKKQIQGYTGAKYKSFPSLEQAKAAFEGDSGDFIGKDIPKKVVSEAERKVIGEPEPNSLAVDAACSGNPGVLEYQGVYTATGTIIFHQGPFDEGTVNIGEFLALVHGLAYLKKRKSNIPIYSDSRTAIKWVKTRQVKTKLVPSRKNKKLFEMIDRAIIWLKNNDYENPILKWETGVWGEIPADFGRK